MNFGLMGERKFLMRNLLTQFVFEWFWLEIKLQKITEKLWNFNLKKCERRFFKNHIKFPICCKISVCQKAKAKLQVK